MFNMGLQEWLIIGFLAVVLFGKRLPDVARSLGQSYHQFRRGLQDVTSEVNEVVYSANADVRDYSAPRLTHDRSESDPLENSAPSSTEPAVDLEEGAGPADTHVAT